MTNRLEELWMSADDGAFAPVGPPGIRTEADLEHLLDAWSIERRNTIECEIVLDESLKLIKRLLYETEMSPTRRKQARRLLKAIDLTLRMVNSAEED